MRVLATIALLSFTACAGQPRVERAEIPPRRIVDVETKAERQGTESVTPIDEEATRAFLDREIDRRDAERPIREPEPPRTVYVREPYYAPHYRTLHYQHAYPRYYRRHHFGLGRTLFGAGLGAVIGHQSGRRDKGAAIGAGLGLLLDLTDR